MQSLVPGAAEQLRTNYGEHVLSKLQNILQSIQETQDLTVNSELVASLLIVMFLAGQCTRFKPESNGPDAKWYLFYSSYPILFTSSFLLFLEFVVPGGIDAIKNDLAFRLCIIVLALSGLYISATVEDNRNKTSSTNG